VKRKYHWENFTKDCIEFVANSEVSQSYYSTPLEQGGITHINSDGPFCRIVEDNLKG